MNYTEHVRLLQQGRQPFLAAEVGSFQGVSDVLAWMQRTERTRAAVDIIAQDEFEYDFLIQLTPGGDWIHFGIT